MTLASKIRYALVVLIAIGAAFLMWQDESSNAAHAVELLDQGQKVTAEVTGAGITSRKKWGVPTSRRGEVEYQFVTADGQQVSGKDEVDAEVVDAMTDPQDASALKADASVEIVYLAANPATNGVVAELSQHRTADTTVPLFALAIAGLIAWFASGRIMGWLGIR